MMTQTNRVHDITVFGGSGFVGSQIAKCLADHGHRVRIAVRQPESAAARTVSRHSDLITTMYADVRDETSLAIAIRGSDAVVNAVGLFVEQKTETFETVHEIGARNVAHQAATSGLCCLVHLSGIGADLHADSPYIRARGKGELLVHDVFAKATILRPSVIFGPGDKFVNTLERVTRWGPVVPLFGRGDTRLQPVFVGDVGEAVHSAIVNNAAAGKLYELGGPRVYAYRELIEILLRHIGRRRWCVPIPFAIWNLLALATGVLPQPPITEAQVTLMRRDNIVSKTASTLDDLGIRPTALESVLPHYTFS